MGIRLFIYVFFVLAIFSYFYEVDSKISHSKKKERPLVTFTNATMFTINETQVRRIVKANTAAIFKNKEELNDTVIVQRSKNKNNKIFTDNISADFLRKEDNLVNIKGSIKYNRSSFISLFTDELTYDLDKQVAYNKKPFEMIYKEQKLEGSNIYFNYMDNIFSATNTHFEIELKDENETN